MANESAARRQAEIPPMGFGFSAGLFGTGALLLLLTIRVILPVLHRATQFEPVILWFSAAGVCVFTPLALAAAWFMHRERRAIGSSRWVDRLRLHPMVPRDWLWTLGGLVAVGLISSGLVALLHALRCDAGLHPAFMAIKPLTPGRYWILAAWLPFFFINILGEEFLWRGIILPRQESAFGTKAWLVNGTGWLFFHTAFPWQVLVALAPTTLIVPFVVQRRGNTWIGVLLHAALNGTSFLALAFGLMSATG